MSRKKVSGAADYIIPLAVVGAIGYALYKLFGSSGSSGPGLSILPSAVNTALNTTMASSSSTVQTATAVTSTALDAWYGTQTDATDPFLANLYNANNACPSITPTVAQDLWATLFTASNAEAFFKPDPDLSGILSQWQQYITNQCDVSFIAYKCQAQLGTSLWGFLEKYFGNDRTGTSGQTNVTMLYALIQWVAGLPSGLPQD